MTTPIQLRLFNPPEQNNPQPVDVRPYWRCVDYRWQPRHTTIDIRVKNGYL